MLKYILIPLFLAAHPNHPMDEFIGITPEELVGAIKSISVKSYPEELQATYQIFQAKCTTCHGAEDSLQSKEVLPSYWGETTHRMQAMKDSNLSPQEADAIAELMIYDSYKRRKSLLDKQIKALPDNERTQEQAKLDAVVQKYAK